MVFCFLMYTLLRVPDLHNAPEVVRTACTHDGIVYYDRSFDCSILLSVSKTDLLAYSQREDVMRARSGKQPPGMDIDSAILMYTKKYLVAKLETQTNRVEEHSSEMFGPTVSWRLTIARQ